MPLEMSAEDRNSSGCPPPPSPLSSPGCMPLARTPLLILSGFVGASVRAALIPHRYSTHAACTLRGPFRQELNAARIRELKRSHADPLPIYVFGDTAVPEDFALPMLARNGDVPAAAKLWGVAATIGTAVNSAAVRRALQCALLVHLSVPVVPVMRHHQVSGGLCISDDLGGGGGALLHLGDVVGQVLPSFRSPSSYNPIPHWPAHLLARLLLPTQHHWEGGGWGGPTPPTHPPWTHPPTTTTTTPYKFSSGPSADPKFCPVPPAPISLNPKFSSRPSALSTTW